MTVLVDTSVWVDHLRKGISLLEDMLIEGKVLVHPVVIGELSCGNMVNRSEVLNLLANLPPATIATDEEVRHLIESRKLYGQGIGWSDAHILASALITKCSLWTRDTRLHSLAQKLGLAT